MHYYSLIVINKLKDKMRSNVVENIIFWVINNEVYNKKQTKH